MIKSLYNQAFTGNITILATNDYINYCMIITEYKF